MAIIENRESIKRRLQLEAARQWGMDESEIVNGSFDPLVNLLFGALAVESEKTWHEIEASRGRVVKRMVETLLPEVSTGIIPAHSVMMIKSSGGSNTLESQDQYYTNGSQQIYFSPAESFRTDGVNIEIIATGRKIDKPGQTCQRELMVQLAEEKTLALQTGWIGIEVPPENIDGLTLFFNWPSIRDRARFLSQVSLLKFSLEAGASGNIILKSAPGLPHFHDDQESAGPRSPYAETIRNFYHPHFIHLLVPQYEGRNLLRKYPLEWEMHLKAEEKALFRKDLIWLKFDCPALLTPEGLENMEIHTDCFPVLNRKLIRQRKKLQPLFNVFPITDEKGFLEIEQVLNGDGIKLTPLGFAGGMQTQEVYELRKRNVTRFDRRDGFEKLTDVISHMRDDLSAFSALDNSILNNHLETISKSIVKLKEHLDSYESESPEIYLTVRTRSLGNMLEVYFWTSSGDSGNGIPSYSQLNPDSGNRLKSDLSVLMLPSSGGRDPLNEEQMQRAFKEAILTRGKAVTIQDFRTIIQGILGDSAKKIITKKALNIGDESRHGVIQVLEVNITPDTTRRLSEEYWLGQAQLIKKTLERQSTGVLPLSISVEGFKWRL